MIYSRVWKFVNWKLGLMKTSLDFLKVGWMVMRHQRPGHSHLFQPQEILPLNLIFPCMRPQKCFSHDCMKGSHFHQQQKEKPHWAFIWKLRDICLDRHQSRENHLTPQPLRPLKDQAQRKPTPVFYPYGISFLCQNNIKHTDIEKQNNHLSGRKESIKNKIKLKLKSF